MVKVIYSTDSTGKVYYECAGHADYKDPATGNNDICVAVSTINLLLARYLDMEHGIKPVKFEDGNVVFDIGRADTFIERDAIIGMNEVFKAAMLEFSWLSEQYPEAIKVY